MLLLSVVSKNEQSSFFDTTLKTVGVPKARKSDKQVMDFMRINHYLSESLIPMSIAPG
ncbi:hypothetical protein KDA_10310 [Dictyobacter alpinus]|uniref:Uncharacterized protein n=1 Tax=Dictyobacter alpinus TaxID=2014873 RepID=A0A402B2L3_9CHLR|nr:hypothetical protein KDA_10310 [Dictyobacter alpinus]